MLSLLSRSPQPVNAMKETAGSREQGESPGDKGGGVGEKGVGDRESMVRGMGGILFIRRGVRKPLNR